MPNSRPMTWNGRTLNPADNIIIEPGLLQATEQAHRLRTPRHRAEVFEPLQTNKLQTIKSDDLGKYILSPRTFGVEYEINFSWDNAQSLRKLIGNEYNIVHDGTLRNGLEVVSPILGGKAGEQEVFKVCKHIKGLGGKVDDTCGLHIHFGAKDFYKRSATEVWTLEHALKYNKENPTDRNVYFILHDTAIKYLKKSCNNAYSYIVNKKAVPFFEAEKMLTALDEIASTPVYICGGDKMKNDYRFQVKTFHSLNAMRKTTEKEIKEGFTGEPAYYKGAGAFIIDPEYSKNLRTLVIKPEKNDQKGLERLKRLAAFYVTFDDVIMSMLPQDRRENDFTRRVGHRISIEDIISARSVTEFMMMWFKFTHESQVSGARGNGGNGAVRGRYCGVNLYSLFNIGTIEIRYLGGSVDPVHILRWTQLHHAIIDLSADLKNYRGSVKSLQKAALIIDQEKKKTLFFKKLRLPSETERYWTEEMQKHYNDDEVLYNECIEEDQTNNASTEPLTRELDLDAALRGLNDLEINEITLN